MEHVTNNFQIINLARSEGEALLKSFYSGCMSSLSIVNAIYNQVIIVIILFKRNMKNLILRVSYCI